MLAISKYDFLFGHYNFLYIRKNLINLVRIKVGKNEDENQKESHNHILYSK